ncbi:MAG: zinc ribbon-containing protein [Solirubrobacterales bacterium]
MKEAYDKEVDFISGETVVGGSYRCRNCDEKITIPEGKTTNLPVCPNCQKMRWKAASRLSRLTPG